jgi:hypothetical protein
MQSSSNDKISTPGAGVLETSSSILPEITTKVPPHNIDSEVSQPEKPAVSLGTDSDIQYVTGLKLVMIVASVAMACFLMLVDTMVISTVSRSHLQLSGAFRERKSR